MVLSGSSIRAPRASPGELLVESIGVNAQQVRGILQRWQPGKAAQKILRLSWSAPSSPSVVRPAATRCTPFGFSTTAKLLASSTNVMLPRWRMPDTICSNAPWSSSEIRHVVMAFYGRCRTRRACDTRQSLLASTGCMAGWAFGSYADFEVVLGVILAVGIVCPALVREIKVLRTG